MIFTYIYTLHLHLHLHTFTLYTFPVDIISVVGSSFRCLLILGFRNVSYKQIGVPIRDKDRG